MIQTEIVWRRPLTAFAPLEGDPFAAVLHAGDAAADAEWAFVAAFPSEIVECRDGVCRRNGLYGVFDLAK